MKPLVNCPERYSGQKGGHKQMYINVTQPFSHKLVVFNELNDLVIISAGSRGKVLKEREYFSSILEISACEFPYYKRVTNHMAII